MRDPILDASRWQGSIDWAAVKAGGTVGGAMLRVQGSRNGQPHADPAFERNYAACAKLGIPVGVYYYSTAASKAEAGAELAALRRALAGKTLQLPVALDLEDDRLTRLSRPALTDLAAYELGVIQSWGVYAMLYTYLSFAQNRLLMGSAALRPYDLWLAAYRTRKPAPGWPFGMWQYTSKGRVPGISVSVDLSRAYKDYPAIIARAGLGRVKEG